MIIIKLQGGLGNQMFQYALYRKFEQMGKEVAIDFELFDNGIEQRNLQLKVFDLNLRKANKEEVASLAGKNDCINLFFRRYNLKKSYFKEKDLFYHPNIMEATDKYLNGYWQTEKYFYDIKETILRDFQFPIKKINKENQEVARIIKESNSVGIHIRLGDYVEKSKIYGGICTREYYHLAVESLKKQEKDLKFFVFSNDPAVAKEIFENENCYYVDCNSEEDGYWDMYLMSLCKHNIIANSSFSWWGAWLNQNHKKRVIAPSKWINNIKVKDIWCEGWEKI